MNDQAKQAQRPEDKKAAANRENSKLSTGPTTPAGKAKSSKNSLKHGLFAKSVLLPSEDPVAYERCREALWSDLAPANALEALWANEIIETSWRLRRLGLIEVEVYTRRSVSFTGDDCGVGFAFVNDSQGLCTFTRLSQYEGTLTRRLHRAMEEFRALREKGLAESPLRSSAVETTGEPAPFSCNPENQPEPQTVAASETISLDEEQSVENGQPLPAHPLDDTAHSTGATGQPAKPESAKVVALGQEGT